MSNHSDADSDKQRIGSSTPLTSTEPSLAEAAHNWYAKLHPIGTSPDHAPISDKAIAAQPLNLSIFFRIWLAVAVIIIVSGIVAFTQLFEHVKPTTQQVIEDTLVDTSKLLAASLKLPLQTGKLYSKDYQTALDQAFIGHKISAETLATANELDPPSPLNDPDIPSYIKGSKRVPTPWYHLKTHSSFRVYVTDAKGRVIYDSKQDASNAEGQDYSRWNDVYLTLRGHYGARSTAQRPGDSASSVMYVAQPIMGDRGDIIGVVSVGKPVATIVPYLEATRHRMLTALLVISALALIMAGLVAWWLRQSMALVTRYTRSLARQTDKPYFYLGRELNELSDTIEGMKHRLENRAYVTDYVHTLTHELKSPLTAIRASGELLEDPALDEEDRLMLSQTITEQSIKLQLLIDRLLLLAKVEQPTFKLQRELIELPSLMQSLINLSDVKRQQQQLPPIALWIDEQPVQSISSLNTRHDSNQGEVNDASNDEAQLMTQAASIKLFADKFWLSQALQNVLDNAVYFADSQVLINLRRQENRVLIDIFNDGAPIPDYALDKVFDRYFSLSHQSALHKPMAAGSTQTESPSAQALSPKSNSQSAGQHGQAKKGTGLGLTLVKQVVEHHGGSVHIGNIAEDKGSPLAAEPSDSTGISKPVGSRGVLVTIELPLAIEGAVE
ncbi:MAG: two-component system sensor histidine kinase CreC [Psychrobacter sp.]|nr:two-component system sensor histidine kinase CreC [Psychrobacter sp.]